MEQYQALIIDCEQRSRQQLKQLTAALPCFSQTNVAGKLVDAFKLITSNVYSVIFISEDFPISERKKFIEKASSSVNGRDSSWIALMAFDKDSCQEDSAKQFLSGAEEVLVKPYSMDALVEVCAAAIEKSEEKKKARERLAMMRLLQESMSLIDDASVALSMDIQPGASLRKLREIGENIHTFSERQFEAYTSILLDSFELASVPAKDKKKYVSKKLVQKQQKELAV